MAASENRWLELGADDIVILSSHPIPGNETERHQGHRRPGPPRRRGRALRHRRRPRHRPRQAGGAQDVPLDRPARVVHARCTASTATWSPTPSSARQMGVAADHVLVCEDGDQLDARRRRASSAIGQVPAGYLYVDGIVGDVGNGVLRDRQVLAEEGVVVVVVTRRRRRPAPSSPAPRSSPAAGSTPPRPRTCSTSAPTRSARRSRTRSQNDEPPTSRPSSATCAGPPASSSATSTKRRPMIVPVVMEA